MDAVDVQVEFRGKIYAALGSKIIKENDPDIIKSLHHKLLKKIKDNTGLTMNITIRDGGTIPRSEGGKLNRVIR